MNHMNYMGNNNKNSKNIEQKLASINSQQFSSTTTDTVNIEMKAKQVDVDSVFLKLERRKKKIREKKKKLFLNKQVQKAKKDTNKLKEYNPDTIPFFRKGSPPSNFLINNKSLVNKLDYKEGKEERVFIEERHTETKSNVKSQVAIIENKPTPRTPLYSYSEDWMIGVFILSAFLLSWSRLFYAKYFNSVFLSFFKFSISSKLFRDSNIIYSRMSFVLNFTFVLFLALFAYQLMIWKGVPFYFETGILNYFALCLGFATIYIAKQVILKSMGNILWHKQGFNEYIHTIFLLNKSVGIYLLAITLTIAYSPNYFKIIVLKYGLALLIISFLIRIIRGLRIFIPKGVSIFYMILYLCTLEILPILFFYKAGYVLIFRHL